MPKDTNGLPLAPTNMAATELTAFLRTNILTEIVAAGTNLANVRDTNFTLTVTCPETTTLDFTLDYGDVLLLRSVLQFVQYAGYTVNSWNFDVQLTALRAMYTGETNRQSF